MDPIVSTKNGQIKGLIDKTRNGDKFYKFLGVPFAKPPIGDLKFKAPELPESWTDIKDCTQEGNPSCAMDIWFGRQILGSADCLYLNVYTKELSTTQLKPVMVFFYGGGFIAGSASEKLVGAHLMLDEDIVLVVPTYRVGAFGFLAVNDVSLNIPGNAGLKDQNMALKWVQRNIEKFGGDPNNVTIFGVSAGGASVEFHVISPASKGLFHKAIMQSGSVLNSWAWGQHQNAIVLAKSITNKNVTTEKEAVDILQALSDEELALATHKLPDKISEASFRRLFAPVVEKPNPTAFLTENPVDLFASGRYNHVPIIKGMTSNEGIICDVVRRLLNLESSSANPTNALSWTFGLKPNSEKYTKLLNSIKKFYFKKDVLDADARHVFEGDAMFLAGMTESTKLIARTSTQPLYFYIFSAESDYGKFIFKLLMNDDDSDITVKGVPHGIEQFHMFSTNAPNELAKKSIELSRMFIKLWTSFAKTGIPETATIKWKPVDRNDVKYLDISQKPVMKTKPFGERWDFWENVNREISIDKNTFL